MALIVMAFFDTEDNGRTKYSKLCLESLAKTVDMEKHRVFLIDNNSCDATKDLLIDFIGSYPATCIGNRENIGTARAINKGLWYRTPGEVCIKVDNDVEWGVSGWAEELERVIAGDETLGVVGLKRVDVWQNPNHENSNYRTFMDGELEICKDIMGTCTAYSPALLDKIGALNQPTTYGFDDVLVSCRSIAAGFRNAFLPHIPIVHLDEGGTDYTEWKKKEAGRYLTEVSYMCDLILSGKVSYYYDGN